jgi:glycosyl transferase family 25
LTVHVINLDRDQERLRTFLSKNAHVPDIVRLPAIDGHSVNRDALRVAGMISNDLPYTNGPLGCALSHMRLWRKCVKEGRPITIVEDDALFAPNFQTAQELMLNRLPSGWDAVLWGWNFDRKLGTEIPDGVAPSMLEFDQDALRRNIENFRSTEVAPALFRLHYAFGALACSLSSSGARTLLELSTPLSGRTIFFVNNMPVIANDGIDCVMNGAYSKLKAYVCIPPLAVSENYTETSRTRNDFP